MPAFPKPRFTHNFNVQKVIEDLQDHKVKRSIPAKNADSLLIATWNIANLGLQKRWNDHYLILTEILEWFDIIAIQEVTDNLEGLRQLEDLLPSYYNLLFSDKGGNNERAAYLFDSRKIKAGEKISEIAIPPNQQRYIKLPGVNADFRGFDRNPYLASFEFRNFIFILINLHIFFGSEKEEDINRRSLETYALARYADLRRKSKYAYTKNIICLGDFNLPKVDKNDPIYKALTSRGLTLPKHSTKIYSNISNDKQYDQIAFFPGLKSKISASGVFDFDGVIFPDLWQKSPANFRAYLRYYLSDHRPMWMQLKV